MPDEVVGFNISAFSSAVNQKGLMSTGKFMAWFPLPPGMLDRPSTAAYSSVAREINMWCDSAQIPDIISQNAPDIRRFGYGPTEKRPLVANFTDVPLTFISDANGENWQLFRSWMSLKHVFDGEKGVLQQVDSAAGVPMSAYEVGFQEDYCTSVILSNFSDDGTERFRVVLREAHPIMVSPIKMSWGEKKQVGRFTVVMSFMDWYFDFDAVSSNLDGTTRPTFPS